MTPAGASNGRRRLAPFSLGLLLAAILVAIAGRIWPDTTAIPALGLGILAGMVALAIVSTVRAVRDGRRERAAWAALERSREELRGKVDGLPPAEREKLLAALPGFRELMRGRP